MERETLLKLLRAVRAGKTSVPEAMERLRHLPTDDLGFAKLDLHRAIRKGFPEVVYGPGKTVDQIVSIVGRLRENRQTVLVTRVGPEAHEAIRARHPDAEYHPLARALVIRAGRSPRLRPGVVVVTAGTADIEVAEEAALTAELMGHRPQRIYDVGVAGLHRLLSHVKELARAKVIVAVAGMEGALPSVVGGLVDCPVIAVPTSTGYGTGHGGQAALFAMLNSCAPGIAVTNIDNGFGAGYLAALINGSSARRATSA